ncbi:MAG: hypothetical protein AUJ98_11005 [Bacteroidetes bacterium CG2_30_33_31]|nr:MAG: hypothetical protein AUJ98_11005 [Bacteroidetes bacterium CG2_30_33_31]
MKNLNLILIITLLISCSSQKSNNDNLVENHAFLIGRWTGQGEFLDNGIKKTFGSIQFDIEIQNDNSISGKIGDAILTKASIKKAKYGFEIKGILDSEILKNKSLGKRHLIILIVETEGISKNMIIKDANFHLKKNYFFDISMRVGGLTLTKIQ